MKNELEKEFEALWETDFGGKHFDVIGKTDLREIVEHFYELGCSHTEDEPTWKPSEEQIRSLEYFVKLWGNTDEQIEYVKIFNDVKSLLGDLKKL